MSSPFEKSFSGLTNVQLLEVIRNAGDYDPQAVDAANLILEGRDVRPEEYTAAEQLLHAQRNQALNKRQLEEYKERVSDVVYTLSTGEGKPKEERWITYFLILLFIEFAQACAEAVKPLTWLLRSSNLHSYDLFAALNLLPVVYLPVIFFLVYKRRKWGWILVFAQTLWAFVNSLWVTYELFYTLNVVALLIEGLFLFFLYKQGVADRFGVTKEIKVRTAWVTTGIILLAGLILYALD